MDPSGGPVLIDVRDSFVQRGIIANAAAIAPHVLFSYLGVEPAQVNALGGTLVSFNATARLAPLAAGTHHGAVFAKGVELAPGTTLVHASFEHWQDAVVEDLSASNGRRSMNWDVSVKGTASGTVVDWRPLQRRTVDVASLFDGIVSDSSPIKKPTLEFLQGSESLACVFGTDGVRLLCNRAPLSGDWVLERASTFLDVQTINSREIVRLSDIEWEAWFCRWDPDCDLGCWVNSPRSGGVVATAYRAQFSGFDYRDQQSISVEIRTVAADWEPLSLLATAEEKAIGLYKSGAKVYGYGFNQTVDVPLGDIYWRQRGHGEIEARLRLLRSDGTACSYLDESGDEQTELVVTAPCGTMHETCCLLQPQCPGDDECGQGRCVHALPDVAQVDAFPALAEGPFAREANGVAHDELGFWYFSNTPNDENWIWKYPVTSLIAGQQETRAKRVFASYDHVGDIDYFGGYLYVPLENENRPGRAIGLLDRELNEVALVPMGEGTLPWVAVDPRTGRLYTSGFNASDLQVFQIVDPGPNVQLVPLPSIALRLPPRSFSEPIAIDVQRIQGGAFSPSGTLYLVSDIYPYPENIALGPPHTGGIQAIVAETGVARFSLPIQYDQSLGGELEGIDFGDLENSRPPGTPNGLRGQIHAVYLGNDLLSDSDDQVALRHFLLMSGSPQEL